ncbi:dsDNA binding protein [Bacillus phage Harambe]|uniref:Uncharacterized protein n=2 Tax=Harambevirus TaxID=2842721 RepID=A0A1W6JSA6_9CAUD|nr:dsDNA binding protein [Bacillus phage Harambe]YP_009910180.1 dsDNA binding protein [Bacillus phage BeachBum]ARM70150.1 hypothetical protein HARAMBE_1 [Bacillus phage Harambe]ARQ95226.1 hypothetical protein BEACHBUM_1 [Bacillus phage BeachBum]
MSKYVNRQIMTTEIKCAEVVVENGEATTKLLPVLTVQGRCATDIQAKNKAIKHFEKDVVVISHETNVHNYRMLTEDFMEHAEIVTDEEANETEVEEQEEHMQTHSE